jgi:hypothetical protein
MSEIKTGRRFPFVIMPLWVVDHPDVTPLDVAVYIAIKRHADVSGEAYPSRARIAEVAKCSVDSVDRAVKRLMDVGALEKEVRRKANGDPTSNLYTIHEEPDGYRSQRQGSRSQRPGVAAQSGTNLEPIQLEAQDALNYDIPADTTEWTPMPDTVRAMLEKSKPREAS